MTVNTIVSVGDSLSEGSEPVALPGNFSFAQGGKGAWWELAAERLSNLSTVGPRISSGFRSTALGDGTVAYAGAWTDVTAADLFDKGPYGLGKYSATGTGGTVTFTRPAFRTVVGFALYWIDLNRLSGTNGGNWSYSVDGGTYTAMGQTIAHDNGLKKFYVSGAVTSSVAVRAANAAGTAVGTFPIGIEWFYLAPSTTTGLIWHNLALNGMLLRDLVGGTGNTTVGDRMAFFDAVTLGSGSPISNQPNVGILLMHGRDVTLNSTSQWNTDLGTFWTRVHSLAPQLWMNHFELAQYPDETNSASPGFPWATQTSYRDQLKTTAAAKSPAVPVFDQYDRYASMGWGPSSGTTVTISNSQNVALRAAGILYALDNGHQLAAGHLDQATAVYWQLRNRWFSVGSAPSSYVATGKQAAVAVTGKQAAVAYSTASPIAVTPV